MFVRKLSLTIFFATYFMNYNILLTLHFWWLNTFRKIRKYHCSLHDSGSVHNITSILQANPINRSTTQSPSININLILCQKRLNSMVNFANFMFGLKYTVRHVMINKLIKPKEFLAISFCYFPEIDATAFKGSERVLKFAENMLYMI